MAETKKPRKPRKDKGKKRGKRTKNPRLQTGSIDFRTIGTNAISGPNLTSLIGTLASLPRQVQPNLPQQPNIQEIISTELAKYAPRDVIKTQNFPQPPQERADVEQGQEETPLEPELQSSETAQYVKYQKKQKDIALEQARQAEEKKIKLEKELKDMEMYGIIQQELQSRNLEELRQKNERAAAELMKQTAESEQLSKSVQELQTMNELKAQKLKRTEESITAREKIAEIKYANTLQEPKLISLIKQMDPEYEKPKGEDLTDLRIDYLLKKGIREYQPKTRPKGFNLLPTEELMNIAYRDDLQGLDDQRAELQKGQAEVPSNESFGQMSPKRELKKKQAQAQQASSDEDELPMLRRRMPAKEPVKPKRKEARQPVDEIEEVEYFLEDE